jgi:molybdopterin-guanine dinucleotide biosynthesis protein A
VLAGRRGDDGPWEPLFARYDSSRVLPVARASIAAGERGFQRLFARLDVERFTPRSARALDDWDEPGDVRD